MYYKWLLPVTFLGALTVHGVVSPAVARAQAGSPYRAFPQKGFTVPGTPGSFGAKSGNPTPFAGAAGPLYGQPSPANSGSTLPGFNGQPPFNPQANPGMNTPWGNPGMSGNNSPFNFNNNPLTAPNSPYNPFNPINQYMTGMYNDFLYYNGPGAVFNNPYMAYSPVVSQFGYYGNAWGAYPPNLGNPWAGYNGPPVGYQFGPWTQTNPQANAWNQLFSTPFNQQGPFKVSGIGTDPANIFK